MEPTLEDGTLSRQTNNIPDIESRGTVNNPSSSTVAMSQDTLDNSCQVASYQKNSGKSDDDTLKEYGISPCRVVLFRSDVKPGKIQKSDKDLLAENRIKPCFVEVCRLRPALVNHLTVEINKTFVTHYSTKYIHHLAVSAYNEATLAKKKLLSIKALYKKTLKNRAHSFDYKTFKSLMSKSIAMHRMELRLKRRLQIRKKMYCEGNRIVLVDERDLELSKVAVKNVNRCQIALPYDRNYFSMVSRKKMYDKTNKEAEIKKKQRVNLDSGSYIIVEKEEEAKFRAAVKTAQHCNVFPDSNINPPRLEATFPNPSTAALQSYKAGSSSYVIGSFSFSDLSDYSSLIDGSELPISDIWSPFSYPLLSDEQNIQEYVPMKPQETTSAQCSQPCDPNIQPNEIDSKELTESSEKVNSFHVFYVQPIQDQSVMNLYKDMYTSICMRKMSASPNKKLSDDLFCGIPQKSELDPKGYKFIYIYCTLWFK